jgi:hypothetical protein
MVKALIYSSILFFSPCVFSQWMESSVKEYADALTKCESLVSPKMNYSFESVYNYFDSPVNTVSGLTQKGSVLSIGGNYLMFEQAGMFSIQDEVVQITIDSASMKVMVKEPDSIFMQPRSAEMMNMLLNGKCKVTKKVEGKHTAYSFEFSPGAQYKGVEVWFDTRGMIVKYIMYAGKEVVDEGNFMDEPKVMLPRLEVEFKQYVWGEKVDITKAKKISEFVIKEGAGYRPTSNYIGYEIVDLRKIK